MLRKTQLLEEKIDELQKVISAKDNILAGIYEQCTKGKKQNLAVAYTYYQRIMDLATLGQDIKKETDIKG